MRGRICVLVAMFVSLFISAGSAQQLTPEWVNYSVTCEVTHVAAQGEDVWVGTSSDGAAHVDADGNVAFYVGADGLPSDQITALACDGLTTWLGTRYGVTVIDAGRLRTYNSANSELLTDNVRAIDIDPRTITKYIGTVMGLSVYDGVDWKSYTPYNSDLASPYVSAIYVDGETDEVFVGTDLGVSVMDITSETWRQYKVEHGLVANKVTCIDKDINGNYWIGTYEGVSRFDGVNWYSYTLSNGALTTNWVNDVSASPDGYVFVATFKGLNRLSVDPDSGELTVVVYDTDTCAAKGLISEMIDSVDCDSSGTVWLGTESGLLFFDGSLTPGDATLAFGAYMDKGLASNYATCITAQDRTAYWFGTEDSGASKLDATGMHTWSTSTSGIGLNKVNDITSHFEKGRWYEWFGYNASSGEAEFGIFDGSSWINLLGLNIGVHSLTVEFVDPNPDTQGEEYWNKWMCTLGQGVFVTSGTVLPGVVHRYTTGNSGLLSNTVYGVSIDDEHNKWFSTANGVSVLAPDGSWADVTALDGLTSNTVHAVDFLDDAVWFGTDMGVSVRNDGEWTSYQRIQVDAPMISDAFSVAAVENVGSTCVRWFGGKDGLLRYDGAEWVIYKEMNSPLLSSDVRDIAIDDDGTKWVCTAGGVASIDADGNFWVTETTIDVRGVDLDEDGDKWFAAADGVWELSGATWTHYTVAGQGLSSDDVRCLAIDRVGRVWAGTANGLCVIDSGAVTLSYNTSNCGIATNDVAAIVIDRNGIKWVGTSAGVCKFDGLMWRTFDTASTFGRIPSDNILSLRIDNGFNIWAGTSQGVSRYDYVEWEHFGAELGPLGYLNCQVGEVANDCVGDGLWFCTQHGLVRLELGQWKLFLGVELGSNMINDLKVDKEGKVWVATDYGISVFADGRWTAYNRLTGGPAHDVVRSITVDMDDNKWFATAGGGVSVYLENHDPGLSTHSLSPKCRIPAELFDPADEGETLPDFQYTVYFTDPDLGISLTGYSAQAHIYIDNELYDMTPIGAAYNGVYSLSIADLPVGEHTYYFEFIKPSGNIVRLPVSGVFCGPTVDDTPPTSSASPDASVLPYGQGDGVIPVHYFAKDEESGINSARMFMRKATSPGQPKDDWLPVTPNLSKSYGLLDIDVPVVDTVYGDYIDSATYQFLCVATNNAGLDEYEVSYLDPEQGTGPYIDGDSADADCFAIYDDMPPSSSVIGIIDGDWVPVVFNTPALRIPIRGTDDVGMIPTSQYPYIDYEATGYEQSGVDYIELEYRHEDDEEYTTHSAVVSGARGMLIVPVEREGWYWLRTTAVDLAGNRQSRRFPARMSYDSTPPESSCSTVETPAYEGQEFDIGFRAADVHGGLKDIKLYYSLNGGQYYHYDPYGYEHYNRNDYVFNNPNLPSAEGTFTFLAAEDGIYTFYTIAEDMGGNVEAPPATPDARVYSDTTPPAVNATCAEATNRNAVEISYSCSDKTSGFADVTLWYRFEDSGWFQTPLTQPFRESKVEYGFNLGEGQYYFAMVGRDRSGNNSAKEGNGVCSCHYETVKPNSICTCPAEAALSPVHVEYTASDVGSGLADVVLYYRYEGNLAWTETDFAFLGTPAGGSFSFLPLDGGGKYEFYTIAIDKAGNKEAAPPFADCSILLDLDPPTSTASAPSSTRLSPIRVDFVAEDDAFGIASVELWFDYAGEGYQRYKTAWGETEGYFMVDTKGVHGIYSFYTIATDRLGRKESVPVEPDAQVMFMPSAAAVGLLEDEHDFGLVLVDKTSTWSMRIVNTGDCRVTIEDVRTSSTAFEALFDAPVALDPGDHLPVSVAFTPNEVQRFEGSVEVITSDQDAPAVEARVVGQGTNAMPPSILLASTGSNVTRNERLVVSGKLSNPGDEIAIDAYVAVRLPGSDSLYFYPSWDVVPQALSIDLAEGAQLGPVPLIDVLVDDGFEKGEYVVFGAVVTRSTQYDVLGDISTLIVLID